MRRQFPCDACAKAGRQIPSKYKCPACDTHSCSLPCVKRHKASTKCTGIRNRAAPIRKQNYDDAALMSDYTLLEDAARTLRAANRLRVTPFNTNSSLSAVGGGVGGGGNGMSKGRMTMLAREAAARNTDLRFLPPVFVRHRRNATVARRPDVLAGDSGGGGGGDDDDGVPGSTNGTTASRAGNDGGKGAGLSDDKGKNNKSTNEGEKKPTSKSDNTDIPASTPSNIKSCVPGDDRKTNVTDADSKLLAALSQENTPTSSGRVLYWTVDVHVDVDGSWRHVRVDNCDERRALRGIVHGAVASLRPRRGVGGGATGACVGSAARGGLGYGGRKEVMGTGGGGGGGGGGGAAVEEMAQAVLDDDVCIFLRNEPVLAARSDVVHLPAGKHRRNQSLPTPSHASLKGDGERAASPGVVVEEGGVDVRKFIRVGGKGESLREVLDGRCVVEFPVVHVVRKGSGSAVRMEGACCGIFDRAEDVSLQSDGDESESEEEAEEEAEEGEVGEEREKGETVGKGGEKEDGTSELEDGEVREAGEVQDKDGDGDSVKKEGGGLLKRGREQVADGESDGGGPTAKRARVENKDAGKVSTLATGSDGGGGGGGGGTVGKGKTGVKLESKVAVVGAKSEAEGAPVSVGDTDGGDGDGGGGDGGTGPLSTKVVMAVGGGGSGTGVAKTASKTVVAGKKGWGLGLKSVPMPVVQNSNGGAKHASKTVPPPPATGATTNGNGNGKDGNEGERQAATSSVRVPTQA